VIYLNGQYLEESEARVSVMDRGFLFGDSVYEVIPVFDGHPFRLVEHLNRLKYSLAEISVAYKVDEVQWREITAELCKDHIGTDCSLYLQISRGAAPERKHAFPDNIEPTVMAMVKPSKADKSLQQSGIRAISCKDIRWQRCDIKSTSMLGNVLMTQQAVAAGADEAILVRDGYVTEGASCNVFAVIDGVIYTAPKGPHLLGGITRELVIELASKHGLELQEKAVSVDQLRSADEVWISSSNREILAVVELDGEPIADGIPGPLCKVMQGCYGDYKASVRAQMSGKGQ
jgi:D-alanine transaminase